MFSYRPVCWFVHDKDTGIRRVAAYPNYRDADLDYGLQRSLRGEARAARPGNVRAGRKNRPCGEGKPPVRGGKTVRAGPCGSVRSRSPREPAAGLAAGRAGECAPRVRAAEKPGKNANGWEHPTRLSRLHKGPPAPFTAVRSVAAAMSAWPLSACRHRRMSVPRANGPPQRSCLSGWTR